VTFPAKQIEAHGNGFVSATTLTVPTMGTFSKVGSAFNYSKSPKGSSAKVNLFSAHVLASWLMGLKVPYYGKEVNHYV
jgi:hypothetical protein